LSIEEIFGPSGLLSRCLPDYEYRPSQLKMAEAVQEAIQLRRHLCVEAGTGTGKTLAYLAPLLFANKRVLVSTATKNLQEQLFFKDIPFAREHISPNLSVTYMKGRQNYVCLRKLEDRKPHGLILGGAETEWAELRAWAAASETGDRSELPWIGDNDPVWKYADADSETCLGQKCPSFSGCFITRMRQRALESDLVVVNHSLLFANLALESDEIGRVLPDFSILILDEAHEVEDVACANLGSHVTNYQVEDLCRDFRSVFRDYVSILGRVDELENRADDFFQAFPGPVGRHSLNYFPAASGAVIDLRLELSAQYQRCRRAMEVVYDALQSQRGKPSESDALQRRLTQLTTEFDAVFAGERPDDVYWFERSGRGVALHKSPIDIAAILRQLLFDRVETVILTSATLSTGGDFEYIKERLGVPEPHEVIVPGEFDYSRQAILYVPNSFPEPRSPEYFARALREIVEIIGITEGHAFLLCTSTQQMSRMYRALLGQIEFPLLCQGDMPKTLLLDKFKQTPHAVLCATASFWQGVDVKGDALRAVIVDKLPFQAPSEPVVAARIHRLEQQGRDAFLRYSVPQAIITLKQGLGRLIRSRSDRGILAVLDSRLRFRKYGRIFLESLPNCPVTDNMNALRNFFYQSESV
jgi:ATP-dependent DNA helicase DinG